MPPIKGDKLTEKNSSPASKRAIIILLAMAALVAAIVVYYLFDPASSPLFPKCPFRLLTGLDCPGCGSQRAVHALLHLELAEAFRHNAFLVLTLPFTAVVVFAALFRRRFDALYMRVNSSRVIETYGAATLCWWVLRNVFGW